MPILQLLNETEQKKFDCCPTLSAKQKEFYFRLDEEILSYIDKMRSPYNQVGFLVQLAYFRAAGKFFYKGFKTADLKFACRILELDFKSFPQVFNYSYKSSLRHKSYILEYSGWQNFTKETSVKLNEELSRHALQQMHPKYLLPIASKYLINNKIELPPYYTLAELISDVYNKVESRLITIIEKSLTDNHKSILDSLIWIEDKRKKCYKYSALSKIKQFSYSTKTARIEESIKNYRLLKAFYHEFATIYDALNLSMSATNYYSEWVSRSKLFQLKQFKSRAKAHLYLLAHIKHQYFKQTDLYIDILLKLVNNAINTMDKNLERYTSSVIHNHKKVIESLINTEEEQKQAFKQILNILDDQGTEPESKIAATRSIAIKQLKDTNHPLKNEIVIKVLNEIVAKQELKLKLLKSMGASLQRKLTPIICELTFSQVEYKFKPLLNDFISSNGQIDKNNFLSLLAIEDGQLMNMQELADARTCKAILFKKVFTLIKSGQISFCHSYNYLPINKYLIDENRWEEYSNLILETSGLAKFTSFDNVINSLQAILSQKYAHVNTEYYNKNNKYLSFNKKGEFIISTPQANQFESEDKLATIFTQDGIIPISAVLKNINNTTNFVKCFKHHAIKKVIMKPSDETIYAGLISKGCNHGALKMANISKGINKASFASTLNWFFSLDNVQAANNTIIEYINKLSLPDLYKLDGHYSHTSSDGQKFNVGVDSILANYSFKYFGQSQGISVYTFIDDRQVLFHSTVLSPGTREAAFVIDGIMANNVIKSFIHSTDTHGYSEAIFAVMHFLGVSFAPRIKRVGAQQLYCIDSKRKYNKQDYKIKPDKKINTKLIQDNWDNILKLIATIKTKTTPASQIFSRLNSYTKEPVLYKALKEFGRIIKTAYILTYIDDVLLRQKVEKQLNRIESSNKFARAVFFANSQEFKVGGATEQKVIVACRVFLQNCIILWNYLYLSQFVLNQTDKNQQQLLQTIKNSSVISWQHINLHGIYDFTASNDEKIADMIFDLDKIRKLKIA